MSTEHTAGTTTQSQHAADSSPSAEPETQPPEPPNAEKVKKPDPVRRLTIIVVCVIIVLFVWYVAADRFAPWTDEARVNGFVVPLVPQVSGRVVEMNVENDQVVETGQALLHIDPRNYEIAVRRAQAEAQVSLAEAELERAKEQLGKEGKDNPALRSAVAALEQAQIDLKRTTIYAPGLGIIANLKIDEGNYANAGTPLMTFVSGTDVWIQANMRENSIGNVKPGNAVDIVLDVAPGRVFKGVVKSIGVGVAQGSGESLGQLQTIQTTSGWLRDAQRFAVIIDFGDNEAYGLRRTGGQADVLIYTGDRAVLNTLGRLWIRFLSILSYVY